MSSPETDLPIGVQWANFYRKHKLQVIPAIAGQKRPGLEAWEDLQNDLASQAVFDRWFGPYGSRQNTTALGVIPIRGQFIVDLDVKPGRDGLTRWQEFIETHLNGIDPETWESVTGGGGRHKWFQAPDGWIPPTVKFPAVGWDVRGQGGYVVVPPTLHASGQHYAWAEGRRPDECDLAPAPLELIAEIERLRALGSSSGTRAGHVNAGPGALYDKFGIQYDGREEEFRDLAWAICVDHYRDLLRTGGDVIGEPNIEFLRGEIDAAYDRFLVRVKVREDDPPGATEEERLTKRGYGRDSLRTKVVKALRKWHTKVREDAMRGDPDDPGPGARPDVDSDFNFSPREEAPKPPQNFGRPFASRDPATLPPREWIYKPAYPRKYLTVDVAAGGVGKSTLVMAEAVAMATGRNLLGVQPEKRAKTFYWNGEDPQDEIERRIYAILAAHRLSWDAVDGWLYVGSGRDPQSKILIAQRNLKGNTEVNEPLLTAMASFLQQHAIEAAIIDPFVRCHDIPENDNGAIESVAEAWGRIAELTNGSVKLVHHFRKTNGGEVTVEDARGAVALIAAARHARVMRPMSADEAAKLGVEDDERSSLVRVDNGKANLTPPAKTAYWFKLDNISLPNGDQVQAARHWTPPNLWSGVNADQLVKVQAVIQRGRLPAPVGWREADKPDHGRYGWKSAVQAGKNWVGVAVAEALGLDLSLKPDTAKAKFLIKEWLRSNALIEITRSDSRRGGDGIFIEVGELAEL